MQAELVNMKEQLDSTKAELAEAKDKLQKREMQSYEEKEEDEDKSHHVILPTDTINLALKSVVVR